MSGPPHPKSLDPRLATFLVPAGLAFLLAAPCLSFTYISDDFNFLERAQDFSATQLFPDPQSAFYRPIPRELYFALLNLLGSNTPVWGHLVNALVLAGTVALMAAFVRRIGGERLGILSGLLFASLGALPCLVSWVSCAQDLFAMAFVAAALNLEIRGRRGPSIACFLGALLSKEAALFTLPALVSLQYLKTGNRRDLVKSAIPYLCATVLWGASHHKIRALLLHGPVTGEAGYVGVDNPFMLRSALRTLGTLVNLPPTGWSTPWVGELTLYLIGGVLLLGLFYRASQGADGEESPHVFSESRILWTGLLLGVLPAILTVASAKHWFPYYSCLPAMGTCILLAMALRKVPWRSALIVVAVFMTLGVWYRGTDVGKISIPAEANFRATSDRLHRIESEIKRLYRQFPDSARIYLSVQDSVQTGVHLHLLHSQVVRWWYQNWTLVARPPEYQDDTPWPTYLLGITPQCNVFEIGLPDLGLRATAAQPNPIAYQKALRSYAMGGWAIGDTDRAVRVLLEMQEPDATSWDFDRRLAAALLLASGRPDEARGVLKGFPKPRRAQALDGASAILTPALPRPGLDDAALLVFGLRPDDPEVFRYLMLYFSDRTLLEKTRRMAERLLFLRPGDDEALAMIAALDKVPKWEGVLADPEGWEPPFPNIY